MLKRTITKSCEDMMRREISGVKEQGINLFAMLYSNHKRHTIMREIEKDDQFKNTGRKGVYDYLKNFVSEVIPKVEDFIESRLLERFKLNLNIEEEKMVSDVYKMRKHKVYAIKEQVIKDRPIVQEPYKTIDFTQMMSLYTSIDGKGLSYNSYDDIGRYIHFPKADVEELFPFKYYGKYKTELDRTGLYSIMIREEGLKLANSFSNVSLPGERNFDYAAIINNTFQFKSELKNEQVFFMFFQEFSYSLLKYLEKINNNEAYRLFKNVDVFDGLITLLVRSLIKNNINVFLCLPNTREKILEQLVNLFLGKFSSRKEPLTHFEEIVEEFKIFEFILQFQDVIDFADSEKIPIDPKILEKWISKKTSKFCLHLTSFYELCTYQWRPESHRTLIKDFKGFNSGALLYGEAGCGKSQIMTYLHAWAKENKWIVIPIHKATRFTKDPASIERHPTGLYLQHELAKELLLDFKIINYEILRSYPVDLSLYGKFDMAGSREGGLDPVPIFYDKERKVWSDSWKKFNLISEEEISVKDFGDHHLRIIDMLEKPKNMLEIVNKGIENKRFATCALAEVLYQIYRSETHKLMILVDEYNELYRPSEYFSYRYANLKGGDNKIPPYDIALCRMFMNFDGHLMKNGVKVLASTCGKYHYHTFSPSMINFPKKYDVQVENLRLNDFRNACTYYMMSKFTTKYISEEEVEYLYTMSQGNWKQMHLEFKFEARQVPTYGDFIERKRYNEKSKTLRKIMRK